MSIFRKIVSTVCVALAVVCVLSVCAFATEEELVGNGYCYNKEGKETNIKWTVTEENGEFILRFEIDRTATDKVQTTAITACTAEGKGVGYGNNKDVPWYYGGKINRIIIGEGITETVCSVYAVISTLKSVEVPASLTKVGYASFEANSSFNTFFTTGTKAVIGTFDLSGIHTLDPYCFDGAKMTEIVFGTNIKTIPEQSFKSNKCKELIIPENISTVSNKAFYGSSRLQKVTFEGSTTKINDTAFDGCSQLFTFIGHKDSTAQTFAEKGGYEFVDIDSGDIIVKGTRKVELDPDACFTWELDIADVSSLIQYKYNNSFIVNTYWGFFKAEKTLVFFSNANGYNETGSPKYINETDPSYMDFADDIEKIVIGPGIHKISNNAFNGMSNVKTIEIGINIAQIDMCAFQDCTSLSCVYRIAKEPVEGTADLTMISKYPKGILLNTKIENVKLKEGSEDLNPAAFIGCKNLICVPNDTLVQFVKDNKLNLVNPNNAGDVYNYYEYVNPNVKDCGSAAFFSFDEETGILTIGGAGAIKDIVNYYGGGSKKQPWFTVKSDIKKIIIGKNITGIGKYDFCQCRNLEYVELPASAITISNGAFEKCYNLKAIYTTGNVPVIGTFDLSNVENITSWSFAYNYLVANIVLNPLTNNVGSSAFENCMNIKNVYSTPGSYAEQYADDNGYTFYNVSVSAPTEIICDPPETTEDDNKSSGPAETEAVHEETTTGKYNIIIDNAPKAEGDTYVETEPVKEEKTGGNTMIIVIIGAAVVVAAAVVAILIIEKKRKKNGNEKTCNGENDKSDKND